MKNKPLISVIVPIYNTEEYLGKCIESIIGQTYENLEIILINDGSTDRCGDVCKNYKNKDNRIRLVNRSKGGVTSARKCGLTLSNGEYATFVDSDDWIDPDMYENMLQFSYSDDPDIIACGCIEEYEHCSKKVLNNILPGIYKDAKLRNIYPGMLNNGVFFEWGILPYLCNKLFRKEIILKDFLKVNDYIEIGEDVASIYSCILNSATIEILETTPYHYRQRDSSATRSLKSRTESIKLLFEKIESDFHCRDAQKEIL